MTQEQIEAVRARAITVRYSVITFGGHVQTKLHDEIADDLNALITRLSEVERERDEAREMHRVWVEEPEGLRWYMDRASERAARITELEAEVARLTKAWEAQHADKVKEKEEAKLWFDEAQKRGTELATLRAAVDEAVRRADNPSRYAECFSYEVAKYVTEPLRNLTKPEAHGLRSDGEVCSSAWVKGAPCDCNLTKPDTPSERIMSDKDRENPVEGAHPTQPEGEDALVEACREANAEGYALTSEQFAAALRKALASRGVVRGEGVER